MSDLADWLRDHEYLGEVDQCVCGANGRQWPACAVEAFLGLPLQERARLAGLKLSEESREGMHRWTTRWTEE